jgi:hypothetical protein
VKANHRVTPCGVRPRSRHVAKTTDTRLSLSGWSAPAETRATQQPKSWRPQPSRPNTGETATIARRNSTCDSPKTHRSSEPERFLGHLQLDSPAKVGRFAAMRTPCGTPFARRGRIIEHRVPGVSFPKHRAGQLGRGGLLAKSPLRGLPGRHVKSLPLVRHAARRGLTSRPMVEARSHWRAPLLLLLPIAR